MLDAVASRAAKKAGMQLSIMFDGEWTVAVMAELRTWLAGRAAAGHRTMTFEQFRHDAIAQPHTHKSWGSLPAIACREGLIAPMNHPDGSPVMRRAESEKTHAHPVRLWGLASSFFTGADGTNSPSTHHGAPAEDGNSQFADPGVGQSRLSHSAADALTAVQGYHRERAAMGGQG